MNKFAFVILGFAGVAALHAETFTYVGVGSIHGQAHITLSGVPGPSVNLTVYTGENKFIYGSEPLTYGYCVDLQSMAGNGTASKGSTASLNAGLTIGHLLQEYAPGIHASGDKYGATALQLAIWDLLYDTPTGDMAATSQTIGLTTGNFKADNVKVNGVAFDPSSYFATFEAGFNQTGLADLYQGDSGSIQSFAAVPEPASLAALAIGGLALLRRRKASR